MKIIKTKEINEYAQLGNDIPCFLFNKNCLVVGKGEKIFSKIFPKYYFLLVKPEFGNSTTKMYQNLNLDNDLINNTNLKDENEINENDFGNDFENIAFGINNQLKGIFQFLENLDNVIFCRMTGSGSCCFAVFEKKEQAEIANEAFKLTFPDLWSFVCENNTIID